jgi:hypothetical protein
MEYLKKFRDIHLTCMAIVYKKKQARITCASCKFIVCLWKDKTNLNLKMNETNFQLFQVTPEAQHLVTTKRADPRRLRRPNRANVERRKLSQIQLHCTTSKHN